MFGDIGQLEFSGGFAQQAKAIADHEGAVIEDGAPSLGGRFDGTAKGSVNIVSLQGNYRF
ncbi:hypothetical protein PVT67_08930 [Gallaecimonas kandeliae]|uniref:hypothetical protein n=1 Tax=Gallaecimonas kandeliae TaxID=3029055 RepID=UPI0026494E5F|nr:hypothetical protein [Gallaecimonas kandeliae]WKE67337.1 hypothetical protein PVT67_08930 [Gallaecimonas kandeliae]